MSLRKEEQKIPPWTIFIWETFGFFFPLQLKINNFFKLQNLALKTSFLCAITAGMPTQFWENCFSLLLKSQPVKKTQN